VQHPERETACAAEVAVRAQIGVRDRLAGDQVADQEIAIVVDDDQLVGRAALSADRLQGCRQQLGAAVRDHHRDHGLSHR
jgi:hypothetical protein